MLASADAEVLTNPTLLFSVNGEKIVGTSTRVIQRSDNNKYVVHEYELDKPLPYSETTSLAVKVIHMKRSMAASPITYNTVSEMHALKTLRDLPNIVRILFFNGDEAKHTLVFESYTSSLLEYIEGTPKAVRISQTWLLIEQLVVGLKHVHKNLIIHKNITCDNILVKIKDGVVSFLLSDFYMSEQLFDSNLEYVCCSESSNNMKNLLYKAPEVLCDLEYGASVDIWSLGVSALHFILGEDIRVFGDTVEKLLFYICTMSGLVEPESLEASNIDTVEARLVSYLRYIRRECAPIKELKLSPRNLYISIPCLGRLESPKGRRSGFCLDIHRVLKKKACDVPKEVIEVLSGMLTLSPIQRLTCDNIHIKLKGKSITLMEKIAPTCTARTPCIRIGDSGRVDFIRDVMVEIAKEMYSTGASKPMSKTNAVIIGKALDLFSRYSALSHEHNLPASIACLTVLHKLIKGFNISYAKIHEAAVTVLEDRTYNCELRILNVLREEFDIFTVQRVRAYEINILSAAHIHLL